MKLDGWTKKDAGIYMRDYYGAIQYECRSARKKTGWYFYPWGCVSEAKDGPFKTFRHAKTVAKFFHNNRNSA